MACFLVPGTEAVVSTVVGKVMDAKEPVRESSEEQVQIPFRRKLKWLSNLLWGGSALLAFEHLWHGEVVPFFPFLTAMSDSTQTTEMLKEMGTVGVGMAAVVTVAWGAMCFAADHIVKRSEDAVSVMQKESR
jgi:hypothetical protein